MSERRWVEFKISQTISCSAPAGRRTRPPSPAAAAGLKERQKKLQAGKAKLAEYRQKKAQSDGQKKQKKKKKKPESDVEEQRGDQTTVFSLSKTLRSGETVTHDQTYTIEPEREVSTTAEDCSSEEEDLQPSEAHMEPQSHVPNMEDELAAKNLALEELSRELEEIRGVFGAEGVPQAGAIPAELQPSAPPAAQSAPGQSQQIKLYNRTSGPEGRTRSRASQERICQVRTQAEESFTQSLREKDSLNTEHQRLITQLQDQLLTSKQQVEEVNKHLSTKIQELDNCEKELAASRQKERMSPGEILQLMKTVGGPPRQRCHQGGPVRRELRTQQATEWSASKRSTVTDPEKIVQRISQELERFKSSALPEHGGVNVLNVKLIKLQQKLQETQVLREKAEQELTQTSAEKLGLAQELERLRDELSQHESEITNYKIKMEMLEREKDAVLDRMAESLESEAGDACETQILFSHEEELSQTQRRPSKDTLIGKGTSELTEKLETAENENKNLVERLSMMETDMKRLEEELKRTVIGKDTSELMEKLETVENEKKSLAERLSLMEAELETLKRGRDEELGSDPQVAVQVETGDAQVDGDAGRASLMMQTPEMDGAEHLICASQTSRRTALRGDMDSYRTYCDSAVLRDGWLESQDMDVYEVESRIPLPRPFPLSHLLHEKNAVVVQTQISHVNQRHSGHLLKVVSRISLPTPPYSLEHARITQTELMREKFRHSEEMEELQRRQEELQERLGEEERAREQLALELHRAEGVIDGYTGERLALEQQIRERAELQLHLEQELCVTASRLRELEQERQQIHHERELLSRQQDAMREGAGPRELHLLEETEKLMAEKVEVQRQAQKESGELLQQVKQLEAELEEQVSRLQELQETHSTETTDPTGSGGLGRALRQQIQALEKQLEKNRKFMDEQAADREHERDVFQQEIHNLEQQLKNPSKTQTGSDRRDREVQELSAALQEKADWCSELLIKPQKDEVLRDWPTRSEEKTRFSARWRRSRLSVCVAAGASEEEQRGDLEQSQTPASSSFQQERSHIEHKQHQERERRDESRMGGALRENDGCAGCAGSVQRPGGERRVTGLELESAGGGAGDQRGGEGLGAARMQVEGGTSANDAALCIAKVSHLEDKPWRRWRCSGHQAPLEAVQRKPRGSTPRPTQEKLGLSAQLRSDGLTAQDGASTGNLLLGGGGEGTVRFLRELGAEWSVSWRRAGARHTRKRGAGEQDEGGESAPLMQLWEDPEKPETKPSNSRTVLEEKDRQIAVLNEQLVKHQHTGTDPEKENTLRLNPKGMRGDSSLSSRVGLQAVEEKDEVLRVLEAQVECLRSEQERLKRNNEEEVEQLNAVIEKLQQELSHIEHKQPQDESDEMKQRMEEALREKTAALVVLQAQVQALEESATPLTSLSLQEQETNTNEKDNGPAPTLKVEQVQADADALYAKVAQLEEKLREKVAAVLVSQAQLEAVQMQTKELHAEAHAGEAMGLSAQLRSEGLTAQDGASTGNLLTEKLKELEEGLSGTQNEQEPHKQLLRGSDEELKECPVRPVSRCLSCCRRSKVKSASTKEELNCYRELSHKLQEEIEMKESTITQLQTALNQVSASTREGDAAETAQLLQELQEVRGQASSRLQELESSRDQSSRLQELLQEREMSIALLKDQLHRASQEGDQSTAALLQELQEVKGQAAATREELRSFQERSLKLQEEIETELQEMMLGYEEKIAQMQELHAAEILDMEARHISESESLRRESQQLEDECRALRDAIHTLRSSQPQTTSDERDAFINTVESLQLLISRLQTDTQVEGDWRAELLSAVQQVFVQERDVLKNLLYSHLERLDTADAVTHLSQLERALAEQDERHRGLMGALSAADRHSLRSEIQQLRDQLHTLTAEQTQRHHQDRAGTESERLAGARPVESGSDRLEEMKTELSRTKLELESALQSQHKHLTELDTLRAEVSLKVTEVDTLNERLAREQKRARELQWAFEKEKCKSDRKEETEREEVEDLKLSLEELSRALERERQVSARLREQAQELSVSSQPQVQVEAQRAGPAELRGALEKQKEMNTQLLQRLQTGSTSNTQESESEAQVEAVLSVESLLQTQLLQMKEELERHELEALQCKQQWDEEKSTLTQDQNALRATRDGLERRASELQTELERERDSVRRLERERDRLQEAVRQLEDGNQSASAEDRTRDWVLQTGEPLHEGQRSDPSILSRLQLIAAKINSLTSESPDRLSGEVPDRDSLAWLHNNVQDVMSLLKHIPSAPSALPESAALLSGGSSGLLNERLLRQNAELTGFVSRLTEEKNDLRNQLLKLEEELRRYRQKKTSAESSWMGAGVERQELVVFSSERDSWAQERNRLEKSLRQAEAELTRLRAENRSETLRDLTAVDLDNMALRRMYGKYLRSESFRKALIYQKKYLLLLLGGFQECEEATLSLIARMGGFPAHTCLESVSRQRRGFTRFRSAARVSIALSRMRFLVRRWQRAAGGSVASQIINRNGLAQITGADVRSESSYLHPGAVEAFRERRASSRGRTGPDSPRSAATLQHRFHSVTGDGGGLPCSHLQNYDPDRALTDYISRLEALQRRLGSVQSGSSSYAPLHFGVRR
ncbi:A-kinase anchor protein 9-like [Cyprinus carpio]|uniref:A-kinase anchor protein 9-like n=1 Tax=Cyprinus carpio TaxID=7962 RepID=A0A9Q9XHJ2_CYPCA|nr:A-kinase anchor protein 9-like [Cyprinus carpio]